MKACIKCRAELPDSAGHCVYCGAPQPQSTGPSSGPKATMMGHPGMAEELLAQAQGQAPAARPSGAYEGMMPATKLSISEQEKAELEEMVAKRQSASQPASGQPYGAASGGPAGQPPYGAPGGQPYGSPGGQPYGSPEGSAPQSHGQPQPYGGAQQPYGGAGQPYGGGGQPYGGAQQPYGGAQQPYGAQPGGRAPAFGGANLGIQNAQFGAAAHQPPRPQFGSGPGHYQDAMTEQVKPLRAPGHSGDVSAWDDSLTTQMLVFGVLLVACFVAPWAVGGGKTVFAWSVFSAKGAPFALKMVPILLAATGIVSVALGALRLSASARAFAAVALGLSPIVFQVATAKSLPWQVVVAVVSMVLIVTGLIVRSRLTGNFLGKIFVTVGVVATLALYLVPENDVMPVKMLLDQLADMPGKGKVLPIVGVSASGAVIGLVPLLLTLACLLVWLPERSKAGAHVLAWLLLFWPLVASLAVVLLSQDMLATIKANLSSIFYLPLAQVAWMALGCFGLAGVLTNKANA